MNCPPWPPLDSSFAAPEAIPRLTYGDVELRFARILPGDPAKGFVSAYHFLIVSLTGEELGHINFRVGETHHLLNTAGHIGSFVREEHRGHGYAYQACRALEPFTGRHYVAMVLTADPANRPSIRTIEKLSAEFINEVDVPPHEPAYERGERRKRRYKWTPGELGEVGRTENVQWVNASREEVYRAFLDPMDLVQWLAPDGMSGQIHHFDGKVGGGYEMSLVYSAHVETDQGKTVDREDRFIARFLELDSPQRIVQGIAFASDDSSFQGDMRMVVTLTEGDGGTEVKMVFEGIPHGIRPEDSEAGTASSLKKLADLLDHSRRVSKSDGSV